MRPPHPSQKAVVLTAGQTLMESLRMWIERGLESGRRQAFTDVTAKIELKEAHTKEYHAFH
jgi:hypothetical protein